MTTINPTIAVSPTTSQPGIVVTLEGTNVILTIVLSSVGLLTIFAKTVSKFNELTSEIRDLKEDLNVHANAEGHTKMLEQSKILQKDFASLDKRFDIHLQDYVNYKDASLLAGNGVNEKIDHKWRRTEDLFKELKIEIKDVQQFLHKHQDFKIRE